jgi:TRAP-type C4-dicarboxylate transport system permease large subunit
MIRQGYPPAFSAALVAAGGSIGVIIPPSIPMVIFGFLTNVSIAKLFAGGMLVGILFGLSFMAVAIWYAWRRNYGTRQPFSMKRVRGSLKEAIWSLGAPVIVLGGILSGIVRSRSPPPGGLTPCSWRWPSTGRSNGRTCRP